MIQEHLSRTKHYDFRLEVGEVFKSWALPRGIPQASGQRHLAIQTADHSIAFGDFEGDIPDGEYGAGEIRIWDAGCYESSDLHDLDSHLAVGKLDFNLKGNRVTGSFRLLRPSSRKWHHEMTSKKWLLIKL